MSSGTPTISIEQYRQLQAVGQTRHGKEKSGSAKPKIDYKAIFLQQLHNAGLPAPEVEFRFHVNRLWRLDFAWPSRKLACEYQGIFGAQTASHQSINGLLRDYEKATEAALLGWTLIVITSKTVESGKALEWAMRGLAK